MKDLIKNKKIVIFDIETSGLYCGEDGKEPARILRVDATKIENGKICESFSSLVACSRFIKKYVSDLTGISNKTLKGAPRIKAVLKTLDDSYSGKTLNNIFSKLRVQDSNFSGVLPVLENYLFLLNDVRKNYIIQDKLIAQYMSKKK